MTNEEITTNFKNVLLKIWELLSCCPLDKFKYKYSFNGRIYCFSWGGIYPKLARVYSDEYGHNMSTCFAWAKAPLVKCCDAYGYKKTLCEDLFGVVRLEDRDLFSTYTPGYFSAIYSRSTIEKAKEYTEEQISRIQLDDKVALLMNWAHLKSELEKVVSERNSALDSFIL